MRASEHRTGTFAAGMGLALITMAQVPTFATPATASASEDIVVVAAQGDVQLTVRGNKQAARPGLTIDPPATIRTAAASSIELRQGATTLSVGAASRIEVPPAAGRGAPIERVVQAEGSVFYKVARRTVQKFHVDTPYLAAVVKGTEFNVTVHGDGTIISLFEGRLEVRSPDGGQTVDLRAGQIAIRHQGDQEIRVLAMDEQSGAESQSPSGRNRTDDARATEAPAIDAEALDGQSALSIAADAQGGIEAEAQISDGLFAQADIDLEADVLGVAGEVSLDVGSVAAEVTAAADLDLASGSLEAGAEVGADLDLASADVGVDTAVDLGGDELTAELDGSLGSTEVTADLDADLGSGEVSGQAGLGDVQVDLEAELESGELNPGGLEEIVQTPLIGEEASPAPATPEEDDLLNDLLGGLR